jgi:hypothetical protein
LFRPLAENQPQCLSGLLQHIGTFRTPRDV